MKLIEDLGMRKPSTESKYTKRYGIYECPFCLKHFESKVASVINGKRSCGCVTRELPLGTTNMVFEFISDEGLQYATEATKHRTTMWKVRCPKCMNVSIRTRSSVVDGKVMQCKDCANKTRDTTTGRKSEEEYDKDLLDTHKGSIVRLGDYINSSSKILHKCVCGNSWKVLPSNVLHGSACPVCCKYGFKEDKPAILYYFKVTGKYTHAWKIGVTNLNLESRYSYKERLAISDVLTKQFATGKEARDKEKLILEMFKDDMYVGPRLLLRGNTELINKDILKEVKCIMYP